MKQVCYEVGRQCATPTGPKQARPKNRLGNRQRDKGHTNQAEFQPRAIKHNQAYQGTRRKQQPEAHRRSQNCKQIKRRTTNKIRARPILSTLGSAWRKNSFPPRTNTSRSVYPICVVQVFGHGPRARVFGVPTPRQGVGNSVDDPGHMFHKVGFIYPLCEVEGELSCDEPHTTSCTFKSAEHGKGSEIIKTQMQSNDLVPPQVAPQPDGNQ